VSLLGGGVRELDRMRRAIEERERGVTVELDVWHANICSHREHVSAREERAKGRAVHA
jgi:hypothetical protein